MAVRALYFTTDHLGSTRAFTNASGNVTSNLSYDSFGNSTGSSLTRSTYTGREFDSDTGLYYYRARWYDSQVGRFISEDPIGFGGGVNWYSYVEDNPTNDIDPEGLRGGRGPGHDVSLRRDPRKWLERFRGRRERNRGDSPGHDEQLRTRCRELEKWLLSLIMVDLSEANLHRELMNQYDWCKKKFPKTCRDGRLGTEHAAEESPQPAPSQNRGWIDDGIPRWDDGTPLDPAKYPEEYERARNRMRLRGLYLFPINPVVPNLNLNPGTVPIRPLVWAW